MKTNYALTTIEKHIIPIAWLLFGIGILIHTTSCQHYTGEELQGGRYVKSGYKLDLPGDKMDVDLFTKKDRVLSAEEHAEELKRKEKEERLKAELEANKKERLYKIETKEKKRRVLLIMSCACFALAVIAVIAGVLLEGWKTFGIISIAMLGFGMFFMGMIDMIPMMTLLVLVPIGAGIMRLMYVLKHVAFNKKIKPTEQSA